MERKTLREVVAEIPYPEYGTWWTLGNEFSRFMSEAIVSEWSTLPGNEAGLESVSSYVSEYVKTVYGREARATLVDDFIHQDFSTPLRSGEFDALSYAFFRSAYELMERRADRYDRPIEVERRELTRRVGRKFFRRLQDRLSLTLPTGLDDRASFDRLKQCIDRAGEFLKQQGYYRDHVAFSFDVQAERQGRKLSQSESDFLSKLERDGVAYAVFEMGYPVILPSAVYLFHTVGEAQHHSSRMMEELFDQVGYEAHETSDFDPTGYPSDRVVELWEIRKKAS